VPVGAIGVANFTEAALAEQARALPRGGAPGVFGFRYEHLKMLLPPAGGDSFPMARFAHDLATGQLLPATREGLAISKLVGFEKPGGGARPVAISSTWRRHVGKTLCGLYKGPWAESLGPTQFAVGVPAGTEKLLKLAQTILGADDPDSPDPICLLQIDATNAFNSCSRQDFMRLLRREYPELVPYVSQWYDHPTPLVFGSHTLWSREGTQQGDPFGSFLFCLGLRPALDRILARCSGARALASSDDILLAVRASQLAAVFQVVVEELGAYGLRVNLAKCCAYCPRPGALQDAGLPADLPVSYEGILHLGVPFGTDAFIDRELDKIARTSCELLQEIKELDDPQVALLILRMSAAPRMVHLTRAMPLYSEQLVDHLVQHDRRVADTLTHILGLVDLTDNQRAQIHLPIRLGGFGLLSPHFTHIAGYFGSFVGCLQDVWQRASSLNILPGQASLSQFLELEWIRDARSAWVHDPRLEGIRREGPTPTLPIEQLLRGPWPRYQHHVSMELHQARQVELLQAAPVREQVRLRSLAGRAAGAWLTAFPGERGCRFLPEDFVIACRLRLGARQLGLPDAPPLRCTCGIEVDDLADHLLLCRRGGQRFRRHGAIMHVLREFIASTRLASYVSMEMPVANYPITAGLVAPGARVDVAVHRPEGDQWLDVVVVHPISSGTAMLRRRASGAASAVRDAEATKRRTYGAAAQRAGASFIPFAFDTFGFRGEGARVFLANLARDAAVAMVGSNPPIASTDAADIPPPHTPLHRSLVSALMTKWTRRIACCLQMQNAILIRERRAAAWALATSGARPSRGGSAARDGGYATRGRAVDPLLDQAYWRSERGHYGG